VRDHPEEVLAASTIAAFATVSVPLTEIGALRARPGPPEAKPVVGKYLKNADEQTVAGISALFHALHSAGWSDTSFRDWGVVGVPRFLGRMSVALTTCKYLEDPSYSVSPHIIPNQSLHSLSGTVSLALSLNGPNFGVGGGPNAIPEGLLAALSVMKDNALPGLWVVVTQLDPDPIPNAAGAATNAVNVLAAAIALCPTQPGRGSLQLTSRQSTTAEPVSLGGLIQYLNAAPPKKMPWSCSVPGIGTLQLSLA